NWTGSPKDRRRPGSLECAAIRQRSMPRTDARGLDDAAGWPSPVRPRSPQASCDDLLLHLWRTALDHVKMDEGFEAVIRGHLSGPSPCGLAPTPWLTGISAHCARLHLRREPGRANRRCTLPVRDTSGASRAPPRG